MPDLSAFRDVPTDTLWAIVAIFCAATAYKIAGQVAPVVVERYRKRTEAVHAKRAGEALDALNGRFQEAFDQALRRSFDPKTMPGGLKRSLDDLVIHRLNNHAPLAEAVNKLSSLATWQRDHDLADREAHSRIAVTEEQIRHATEDRKRIEMQLGDRVDALAEQVREGFDKIADKLERGLDGVREVVDRRLHPRERP